jgi:uncharacterized protein YbjQ (UPF0145 family)
MKIAGFMPGLILVLMVPAQGVSAQDKPGFAVVNEDVGVPVFPNDITDRPYTVLGEVKAGVRKATVFSKEASQEKIYKELWERASKLGADAVVNAKYGDSHISAFSWGKTNATGTAIKFNTPAAQSTPNPPVAAMPSEADKN